eukprot:1129610-Prymnesium_polylepis.2
MRGHCGLCASRVGRAPRIARPLRNHSDRFRAPCRFRRGARQHGMPMYEISMRCGGGLERRV